MIILYPMIVPPRSKQNMNFTTGIVVINLKLRSTDFGLNAFTDLSFPPRTESNCKVHMLNPLSLENRLKIYF